MRQKLIMAALIIWAGLSVVGGVAAFITSLPGWLFVGSVALLLAHAWEKEHEKGNHDLEAPNTERWWEE